MSWYPRLIALQGTLTPGDSSGLLDEYGELTVFGRVLFAVQPDVDRPEALSIDVWRYQGMYVDRDELPEAPFRQHPPPLLPVLAAVIDEHALTLSPTNRPSDVDTVRAILWELLVNALAHRDYDLDRAIEIELFADAMLVASPGEPTRANVENGALVGKGARNPMLHSALHRIGLCAAKGTGWPRVVALGRDVGLYPRAEVVDGALEVVIQVDPERHVQVQVASSTARETRRPASAWDAVLLAALEDGAWHRPSDLAASTGIPRSTLTAALKRLELQGLLQRSSTRKRSSTQTYRLRRR